MHRGGVAGPQIAWVRAVKSPYELAIMERAGAIHRRILEDEGPALLREGMTEAEFACELYSPDGERRT